MGFIVRLSLSRVWVLVYSEASENAQRCSLLSFLPLHTQWIPLSNGRGSQEIRVLLKPQPSEFRARTSQSSALLLSFISCTLPSFGGCRELPSFLLKPPLYNDVCQSLLSKTEGKQTNHKKSLCNHSEDSSSHYYISWDEKILFKLAKSDGKRMRFFKLRSGLSLEVRLCW